MVRILNEKKKTLDFTQQVLHGSGWLSEHVGLGEKKENGERGL